MGGVPARFSSGEQREVPAAGGPSGRRSQRRAIIRTKPGGFVPLSLLSAREAPGLRLPGDAVPDLGWTWIRQRSGQSLLTRTVAFDTGAGDQLQPDQLGRVRLQRRSEPTTQPCRHRHRRAQGRPSEPSLAPTQRIGSRRAPRRTAARAPAAAGARRISESSETCLSSAKIERGRRAYAAAIHG